MSITVSTAKIIGKERKEIIQTVQKQIKEASLQITQQVFMAFLEAEVTAKLEREKGSPRHVSDQPRIINWKCKHCGCQDANQFTRDGHYLLVTHLNQLVKTLQRVCTLFIKT